MCGGCDFLTERAGGFVSGRRVEAAQESRVEYQFIHLLVLA